MAAGRRRNRRVRRGSFRPERRRRCSRLARSTPRRGRARRGGGARKWSWRQAGVETVECGEEAFARNAEDGARALRDQRLDEGVPGGAEGRGSGHGGRQATKPSSAARKLSPGTPKTVLAPCAINASTRACPAGRRGAEVVMAAGRRRN